MPPRSSWLHRDTTVAETLERRAARAALLAQDSASGAVLVFAAGLYRAQAEVAAALAGGGALTGSLEQDLAVLRGPLDAIVRYAGEAGPPGLRADVDAYRTEGTDRLLAWWRGPRAGRTDYLARAVLRPYAETLAATDVTPEPPTSPASPAGACTRCGGPAWIGWRRAGSGDEAAQRFIGCAICGSERILGRIACAACGEATPDKLAVYQTERHPAARIEACDTCQRYIKSIDLTIDGRAIPEVDDLCSLSMDLWASEQGYERLEPSLAGV